MAFLNSIFASFLGAIQAAVTPSVSAPGSMWHLLILKSFAFVADYGWRIVVFTVLLKLVLSPLDFYQRYKMYKNQKITERLKPTMEKIQKQYGNDKQAFSQKQMELNRKEGYSYFSSCLPMILTLVVFITLWLSMQTIARYMTFKEYTTLYDEYQYVYGQVFDPVDESNLTDDEKKSQEVAVKIGQDVVYRMYYNGLDDKYVETLRQNEEYAAYIPQDFTLLREGTKKIDKVQASFLWIENIWLPDVPWSDSILDYSAFVSGIGDYSKASTSGLKTESQSDVVNKHNYNEVMYRLLNDNAHNKTNGYLILPILVVLLSLGSQLLMMFQQKRAGQVNAKGKTATSMKVMMIIMPIMMAFFALQYASIFTLYMVMNSATTLFFNVVFTNLVKLIDRVRHNRKYGISTGSARTATYKQSPIIHYVKGANPNAGAKESPTVSSESVADASKAKSEKADKSDKSKKSKKSAATRTVQRGGRPDPNDLMGMDMSNKTNKKK